MEPCFGLLKTRPMQLFFVFFTSELCLHANCSFSQRGCYQNVANFGAFSQSLRITKKHARRNGWLFCGVHFPRVGISHNCLWAPLYLRSDVFDRSVMNTRGTGDRLFQRRCQSLRLFVCSVPLFSPQRTPLHWGMRPRASISRPTAFGCPKTTNVGLLRHR